MDCEQKHFLNVEEAASFLRVSPGKVRKDLRQKVIPHSRIGRRIIFDPDRLARWVLDHAVEPASGDARGGAT
jgi:excisionase family DNA binding protein